ncbi:MAG: elongation factor P [Patescibacteria group bacterium]
MALIEYSDIVTRKTIIFEGEPYEILDHHIFRKQMRKPVNAVKMRNLISGRTIEHSFQATEKAEEAELETAKVKYLFNNKGEWWFCPENEPSKRFKLADTLIGDSRKFLKTNAIIDVKYFGELAIGVKLPVKIDLEVTEAPPTVRGDTAKGGNKIVTLETGAEVQCPMFIGPGDIIRINTDTGEYAERVSVAK